MPEVQGPLTIIATMIADLAREANAGRGKGQARRAEKRARREAEAQRKEWRELVERQKVRGEAGNASYEEAAEALRGAGGRPNPLDQRKF
jgi:hypothetical protein